MYRLHDYIVLPVYPETSNATYKVIQVRYGPPGPLRPIYGNVIADNLNKKEAYELRKKLKGGDNS